MFQLTAGEFADWISQTVTSNFGGKKPERGLVPLEIIERRI
jgi:hypothetical protein